MGGAGVRQLMGEYDVSIAVPASDLQSNAVIVTGTADNAANAKAALEEKLRELEDEKADKAAKSYEVKIEVNPEHHPKIIGRKGAIIQQIRNDFDVNIQLPKKGAPDEAIITITGYEDQAFKAKKAILDIVRDIESQTKEDVRIDRRVHPMLIGRRGTGIRKIMSDFRVDIKFPREEDPDPDTVVIMGSEDAVADCRDHLLNMEEEFLQDLEERGWMDEYMKPVENSSADQPKGNSKGFQVTKAPWHGGASEENFPTLGGGSSAPSSSASSKPPVWGPRR